MSKYFDKFPVVTYDGQPVKNIMARVRFSENTKNDPTSFIPYRVEGATIRPDLIADRYYNDSYLDWIYYYSNEVVDPYHDIVKDEQQFLDYIKVKYESTTHARDIILFYRNNWVSDTSKLTTYQYDNLPNTLRKYYNPEIDYFNNVSGYVRKQIDWTVSTNRIRVLTVNYVSDINRIGDIFLQYYNGTYVAEGTLIAFDVDTNTFTFNNITGEFIATAGNYLVAKYGGIGNPVVSAVVNPCKKLVNGVLTDTDNISSEEAAYWAPVSAYDYEQEMNEEKRNVQLLRSSLKSNADAQLTKLLRT
jgi:hypothetical protein